MINQRQARGRARRTCGSPRTRIRSRRHPADAERSRDRLHDDAAERDEIRRLHVQDRLDQGRSRSRGRTCSSRTRTILPAADGPGHGRARRRALPDLAAIRDAHARIARHVHRTPVMTCAASTMRSARRSCSSARTCRRWGVQGARRLQRGVLARRRRCAGAAWSRIRRAIMARRSRMRRGAAGIPAWVVMPENAPSRQAGERRAASARPSACARRRSPRARQPAPTSRAKPARRSSIRSTTRASSRGRRPPRSSCWRTVPDLDVVVAPCGGGGLLSGTAIAATSIDPRIRVLGAEPANADDAARSFASRALSAACRRRRRSPTACGRRCRSARLPRLRRHVDGNRARAAKQRIVRAMRMMCERMKHVVEPSAAVPLACLLERTLDVAGQRVGIIVTGGNVDLDRLPFAMSAQSRLKVRISPLRGSAAAQPSCSADVRGVAGRCSTRPRTTSSPRRIASISTSSAPTASSCSARRAAASRRC